MVRGVSRRAHRDPPRGGGDSASVDSICRTVVLRALEPVWPPLVTTSYAVLGAVLLVLSRREGGNPMLRQLGGATMLIVVARLLLVDLSSVETIWRVLLFLVIGALFLYTGQRLQPRPAVEGKK